MDESTNGHKRPFGPHGEGCECDPQQEPSNGGPAQPQSGGDEPSTLPRINITQDPTSVHEIAWSAASESFGLQVVSMLNTCAMEGNGLNERQCAHVIAGVLRGFALAKEVAAVVESHFAHLAAAGAAAAEAQQVAEERTQEFHDIAEMFRHRPTRRPPENGN